MEASNPGQDWQLPPANEPAADAPANTEPAKTPGTVPDQAATGTPGPDQPPAAPADTSPSAPAEAHTLPKAEAADDAPAPANPAPDVAAEMEAMRRRLADLESQLSSGALTAAPADAELQQRVDEQRQTFADWPQKGAEGLPQDKDNKGVQPWDLQALDLPVPGKTRDFLPPGPDPISPVVVAHSHPVLTAGTAGPEVEELGRLLSLAGYPNSISRGLNHAFAFDDTITAAVDAFRRDYHVQDDPSQFPTQHRVEQYVGPHTWEALERVVARLEQQAA